MNKRFFTAQEFNDKNWEDIQKLPMDDKWSRKIIRQLIDKFISDKIEQVDDTIGNICFDLRVKSKTGIYYGMEIKMRKEPSTAYKTHLMNKTKYDWFCRYRNDGTIQDGYLISIWYDGVITISHVFENYITENHNQNKTTNVDKSTDYKKEPKDCYCYNTQFKFYFCYEYDAFTNTLKPYFSKEPIDVNALNNMNYKTEELF